jgi:hypothetical protein
MTHKQKQHTSSAAQPNMGYWGILACAALVVSVSACGSTSSHVTKDATIPIQTDTSYYSLVFIIHGDGNYQFHNADGESNNADKQVLNAAIEVALRNSHAEVYIFHQQPARYALFFIPLRDGAFRYYRGGKLIARESYWRGAGSSRFEAEASIYRKYNTPNPGERANFFLYFGHEVSEFDGIGYDASYPERSLNVRNMSEGLRDFTGDSTRFDLLVLSTCFGGTPHTVAALSPYAKRIVASPDNLHLSFLDLRLFQRLNSYVRNQDVSQFANLFARQAFHRLTKDVHTAVTVAVYDTEQTQSYVRRADRIYQGKLSELQKHAPGSVEYVDCDEEPVYVLPGMSDGVYILFRSARFGRSKNKSGHSGWQCCRYALPPPEQIGSLP